MGLDLNTLKTWRQDSLYNNNWRRESATDLDYVDGSQWSASLAAKMEEKGLPLITVNICKGTVETACGLLERQQTDCIVQPEDDEQQDIADVLSYKLKQAERETGADRACLDAARVMFGGGIEWVEVARNADPFAFPYRIVSVPYTEMWADPRSRKADYGDAQYVRRIRFFERQTVATAFPDAVASIEQGGRGDTTYAWYEPQMFLRNEYNRDMSHVALDIWGAGRDLVALEEVQYRQQALRHVFRLQNGKWLAFDENNPVHMAAYQSGAIDVQVKAVSQAFQSIYIGDVPLLERPSPAGGNNYTYVAFVFEREARTGSPYGAVRAIRPLQDETNTRRAKAVYSLMSTRVIASNDAVDDFNELREEISRRDAMIILGKNFKPNVSTFKVEDGVQFAKEQLGLSESTMALVPQISGVPLSLQGVRDGSVDSGVGINALADYGVNSLSRVFSHYKEARRKVFDILLQYIIEDVGPQASELTGLDRDGEKLSVPVNQPQQDEQGMTFIDNHLTAMSLKVVLDDVPHSATHRQEQFKAFAASLAAAPEDIQKVALPYMAQLLDIPPQVKKELVAALKSSLGLNQDDPQAQAAKQKQAQIEDAMTQTELAGRQAKVERDKATAAKEIALTQKISAETAQGGQSTGQQADAEMAQEQQHQIALASTAAKAGRDHAAATLANAQARKTLIEAARLLREPIAQEPAPVAP